jgi:ABC-type nitrate/sulfonate/bicarbonate transport system substrate-binding protein
VAQGSAISNLNSAAIAQGVKARMIWGLAPLPPQSYVVSAEIKTLADLKGKRLSAAGGVGGFNWLMGREALRKASLKVEDATFISQGTAGRLPGLVAGQLDGVVLHPEDVHLAQEKKPGAHVLIALTELIPQFFFNAYGAQNDWVTRDRKLLLDTIAAMIEANRTFYTDKAKVLPIVQKATEKAPEAVEFAWNFITKNCILSVNEGFDRDRIAWTHDNDIANGDVPPEKKLTVDQIADFEFAKEAVAMAGGPTTIGQCKL